jgi:hypothetical protein
MYGKTAMTCKTTIPKPVPEFIDPRFREKRSYSSLKTSVLGLFSRKLGL